MNMMIKLYRMKPCVNSDQSFPLWMKNILSEISPASKTYTTQHHARRSRAFSMLSLPWWGLRREPASDWTIPTSRPHCWATAMRWWRMRCTCCTKWWRMISRTSGSGWCWAELSVSHEAAWHRNTSSCAFCRWNPVSPTKPSNIYWQC